MDYTSPVRAIQNSKYNNFKSDTTRQFEEQYWKNKANNMTETIETLTIQNQALNKRIIDMARIQQELREIIVGYEDDWKKRSRKLTSERNTQKFDEVYEDKLTSTNQLGRLYKQIRILKNAHEIQLTKVVEENKKLKKLNEDHEDLEEKIKQNIANLKMISKQNEQIKNLKRKNESDRDTITRLRQQKLRLISDNEKLRRQIQDIKMRQKIAQKQQQERLMDYTRKFDSMSQPRVTKNASKISQIVEQKSEAEQSQNIQDQQHQSVSDMINYMPNFSSTVEKDQTLKKLKDTEDQLSKIKKELNQSQERQSNFSKQIQFEEGNRMNEKFSHEVKLKKLEGQLIEAKTQLSDVLRKLSPLLERRNEFSPGPQSAQKRAGLSILQLFLKKYKIQAF